MRYSCTYPACMAFIVAMLLLVGLPACVSFQKPFIEEDPQMVALQQALDRIEKLNTTNQQKVEEIYNRVFALQARLDGLEATLSKLAHRPAPQPAVIIPPPETKVKVKQAPEKPVPAPKLKKAREPLKRSPQGQYQNAYEAYAKHRYNEAMALFKRFLQQYPKHDLADNAQYWIGEIYYDLGDYSNAILAFKKVVSHYADRSKAPDALLKIGYSYVALDDPVNARIYLKRVIRNYPFSEAEAKARAKLKELENL
ncbi:MAG: tol-pal system protein YbgF [Deltaproteobacteria bacterium]|nr:tol-pal system protein YbgF [Deltaproteobacteria bacterium]MBW2020464.1 tol-pal system protein YbgF [Deltaproteobacteria bacterium]MBW2074481.1 tol-pal system protein YbgF [Deltaproteobacteria bacterium]